MSGNNTDSSSLEQLVARLPASKRALLKELLDPVPEPIAVIGMACRFPGANSPEEYWQVLCANQTVARDVPPDRWDLESFYDERPATPGKAIARQASFLDDISSFDAGFFGISPREASRMDPQHRLLLEVSWEAFERAGVSAEQLEESDTSVFVGITGSDYWWLQLGDIETFDGHAGMGGAHCIASGRLSHVFNLRGPNAALDTACSSSLVAVHLACQSLRTGESQLALAGGVNIIAAPQGTVFLSQWGALAPDGRCKTFDAGANGFGRGEGCGMVVLKRLSDAVAGNDRILGVIRGSAVNQDGRSTRLSAPNGLAQEAVIRKALRDAQLTPADVSFVETHGTGTPVGDPIEVEALMNVLSEGRGEDAVCSFGSAKACVGHLESAAGVAGLMKAVLSLQHETIPGNHQLRELNPAIGIEGRPFDVPRRAADWPRGDQARYAGVSSFGLSGTNAHLIVGEAPGVSRPASKSAASRGDDQPRVIPVSARSTAALKTAAARLADHLDDSETNDSLRDIAFTASVRRSHHSYRAAVGARCKTEAAQLLRTFAQQETPALKPVYGSDSPPVAFVFSGQGCQWIGMGRQLLAEPSVCRDVLLECDRLLQELAGWSLVEQLRADESASRLGETEVAQPALLAIQAAIVAFLNSVGVRPDVVMGHSAGEIAAAYAAGGLTLAEALQIVCHRARLMQRIAGQGRMAAVGLPRDEVAALLHGEDVVVAAANGPQSTVVAGRPEPLAALLESLESRDIFCRDLGVDYAFHSPQLEPLLGELRQAVAGIAPRPLSTRMISTVTGEAVTSLDLTADHWVGNMRQPVLFADAMGHLLQDGEHALLEIGPHPVLATPMRQCVDSHQAAESRILATLRSGQDEPLALHRCLALLYEAGCDISWPDLFADQWPQCVELPTYPWQHQRYWLDSPPPKASDFLPTAGSAAPRNVAADAAAAEVPGGDAQSLAGYYDRVTDMPEQDQSDSFLTFAPFMKKVPGFSWLLTFHDPDNHPRHSELIRQTQKQLRDVLFRGIDFQAIRSVMDFGCGYGTDVLALAQQHPHLTADGYTISSKQAELGNRKARAAGCQDRVSIYNRDSSRDEFPGDYDLIFGFEVAHYIKQKELLFANIDRHLRDGGFVVLADFIANTVSPIDHEATSSYIITLDEWVELLSSFKLCVVENVDVSQEMSNFLYDPNAQANLETLSRMVGADAAHNHFGSYDGLGRLFEKGLATYALMSIQKDPYQSKTELQRVNRERLSRPTAYREVVERDRLQLEPPADDLSPGDLSPGDLTPGDLTPGDWLYEIDWQAAKLSGPCDERPGAWILLSDQGDLADALTRSLEARGQTCIRVRSGDAFRDCGGGVYEVRTGERSDYRELIAEAFNGGAVECRGIVNFWGLDAAPSEDLDLNTLEEESRRTCGSLLATVQAAGSIDWREAPKLRLVTRNARGVVGGLGSALRLGGAAVWGLGRTVAVEQPRLWGGMVDLDEESDSGQMAEALAHELLSDDRELEVAYRGGQRCVPRLKPALVRSTESNPWNADGAYLLTGGLGDLGLATAARLAEQGVRHLALLQRSALPALDGEPPTDPQQARRVAMLRRLKAQGVTVKAYAADVSCPEQAARALEQLRAEMPPLKGVLHAAGVLDDGALDQLNDDRFARVMAPKLSGAWNLHALTKQDPLEVFVLFSSAASMLGSPGQGNYAAANAGLDALAALRRQQGLPALSINWGPWAEIGMAAADPLRGKRVAEMGVDSIPPAAGVRLLEQLAVAAVRDEAPGQIGALALDINRVQQAWPAAASMPLLTNLIGAGPALSAMAAADNVKSEPADVQDAVPTAPSSPPAQAGAARAVGGPGLRDRLATGDEQQRRQRLGEFLIAETASVLQLTPSDVEMKRPLNRMGIDSLMAIELRNRIEGELSVTVPLVRFLEGATLDEMSSTILEQLPGDSNGSAAPDVAALVDQLGQMSDEEVSRLLADKKQTANKEIPR